jgi:hypothetical protein
MCNKVLDGVRTSRCSRECLLGGGLSRGCTTGMVWERGKRGFGEGMEKGTVRRGDRLHGWMR